MSGPRKRPELHLPAPGTDIPGAAVEQAAAVVVSGGVMLYPTDTIYGLGCDAMNAASVRRVAEIKRRPEERPMLVLVPSVRAAESLVGALGPLARAAAAAFWPGPLTMLFRAPEGLAPWLCGETGKIGIRLPDHPFSRRVMEASGKLLLSTSANLSGEAYVHDLGRLRELFARSVDLFIDAGALPPSPPSTVVDASGERLVMVRPGALPEEALRSFFERGIA